MADNLAGLRGLVEKWKVQSNRTDIGPSRKEAYDLCWRELDAFLTANYLLGREARAALEKESEKLISEYRTFRKLSARISGHIENGAAREREALAKAHVSDVRDTRVMISVLKAELREEKSIWDVF